MTSERLVDIQREDKLSQSDAWFLCDITATGRRPAWKTVVITATLGFCVTSERLVDVHTWRDRSRCPDARATLTGVNVTL